MKLFFLFSRTGWFIYLWLTHLSKSSVCRKPEKTPKMKRLERKVRNKAEEWWCYRNTIRTHAALRVPRPVPLIKSTFTSLLFSPSPDELIIYLKGVQRFPPPLLSSSPIKGVQMRRSTRSLPGSSRSATDVACLRATPCLYSNPDLFTFTIKLCFTKTKRGRRGSELYSCCNVSESRSWIKRRAVRGKESTRGR